MRTLQYIFNVLMAEGILELEHDDDGKGNWSNWRYTIKGTDPFYITDEAFAKMEVSFGEKFPEEGQRTTADNLRSGSG